MKLPVGDLMASARERVLRRRGLCKRVGCATMRGMLTADPQDGHGPFLLLDVEGTVSLSVSTSRSPAAHRAHRVEGPAGQVGVLRISPELPGWLAELCEVVTPVWCTTWFAPNATVGPLVGLPADMRRVPLQSASREPVPVSGSWKVPFVQRWAAREGVTELAWIDDEVRGADRELLDSAGISALLLATRPDRGIERSDVDRLLAWAQSKRCT